MTVNNVILSPKNYSVLCTFLFTLELSTPLESGECVLSAYEITFFDNYGVSAAKRTELFCSLCVLTPITGIYSVLCD